MFFSFLFIGLLASLGVERIDAAIDPLCSLVASTNIESIAVNAGLAGWSCDATGTPTTLPCDVINETYTATWYGIGCHDQTGVVEDLHLSIFDNLEGTLPAGLGGLTTLTYLRIAFDGLPNENGRIPINGTIPVSYCELTNLKELLFYKTFLEGNISSCLGELTELRQLDLSHNELDSSVPGSLGETSLTRLFVNDNKLTGTLPGELCSLTGLTTLQADENSGITCFEECLSSVETFHTDKGCDECTEKSKGNVTWVFYTCAAVVLIMVGSGCYRVRARLASCWTSCCDGKSAEDEVPVYSDHKVAFLDPAAAEEEEDYGAMEGGVPEGAGVRDNKFAAIDAMVDRMDFPYPPPAGERTWDDSTGGGGIDTSGLLVIPPEVRQQRVSRAGGQDAVTGPMHR